MKAWHFTTDTLRDGSPIPEPGVTLRHDGPVVPCKSGFHASVRALDALTYAPGHIVHYVKLGGEIIAHGYPVDKHVGSERTIEWTADAKDTLRHFARLCALDVIHLWDAPDIVWEYLGTGDENKRAAVRAAAWDAQAAAGDAAWAARAAAGEACDVQVAARVAAWDARAAAGGAAWTAAGDAQNERLEKMLMELKP